MGGFGISENCDDHGGYNMDRDRVAWVSHMFRLGLISKSDGGPVKVNFTMFDPGPWFYYQSPSPHCVGWYSHVSCDPRLQCTTIRPG